MENNEDPDYRASIRFIGILLDGYIHRVNKIFFFQFSLKFPGQIKEDQHRLFIRFLEAYFSKLKQGKLLPLLLWCRKKEVDKHVYHCGIMVNGDGASNSRPHLVAAEACWAKTLGLKHAKELVGRCTVDNFGEPRKNGLMLKNDKDDKFWINRTIDQWFRYFERVSQPKRWEKSRPTQVFGIAWMDEHDRVVSIYAR